MRLEVTGTSYDSAAEAYTSGNQLAAMYFTSLTGKLSGYAAMAGDDKSSEDFVHHYDEAARETVGAAADLVQAFATMGALTSASGMNHRDANARSVYRKPAPVYDGTGGIRGLRTALLTFKNVRAARSASTRINDRLWSSGKFTGKIKANARNVKAHYTKHKGEFPEIRNSKEYLDRAKDFMSDPPPGTYTRVREPGGDIMRYNPDTNTLGIMDKDGVMKTMFKPDPSKHGFTDNWEYFLNG